MNLDNSSSDHSRAPFGGTNGASSGNTSAPFTATAAPFPTAARYGATPKAGADLSVKELVDLISHALLIIRSKWYWGVLGAFLVAGPIGFLLFTRPHTFKAETAVLAQSTLDKVLGADPDFNGGSNEQSHENNLRNHLSMMTSRKFRARLMNSFSDDEKKAITNPYHSVPDDQFFQDYFDGSIDIERERGREYYTITVTHRNPDIAIMIADRFVSEYIGYVQQEFKEANLIGYNLLEKQADAVRTDIAKVESERLDFRKKNGIISRADNQSILTERLKRLDASLTDIRVKKRGLETLTKQAQADRARSKFPWDNAYLASFGNNEALRQELDRQIAQRAVLASRYGPNHPKMRDAGSQISAIEASIQRNFDVAVRDLESQLDVAVQNETLLQKEFDDSFASSIEIEKLATNYEILSAGVDSKKITLDQLEKKIAEASISSKLPTDFMQIVDPAYLVQHKVPREVLYAVFVAFVAFGAFLASPLLASALDERVTGTSDVEKVLGLSLAGGIPILKMRLEDRPHVVRNKLDLVTSESFIAIVGHLDVTSVQRYPRVLVLTSTLPSEGKSLIASNLASTFRQLGKKTLLIDLDLRRPIQHHIHNVPAERGFLTWARTNTPVDENLLQPDNPLGIRKLVDGTDLITAGGSESQPSQYLIAESMDRLIAFLQSKYDVIVVDTPPAGVFQDALILSRFASERVLVTREQVAPVIQVKKVIDEFANAGFAFQGLVLNGFNPHNANKKLAYGYRAASKGYAYHKTDKKPAKGTVAKR